MSNITIASYGWEGENWMPFYPEDLPEDWRLDYFCNQFSAIVIPKSIVENSTDEHIDEWLEAVEDFEDFKYFLDIKDMDSSEYQKVADKLGAAFSGFVSVLTSNDGHISVKGVGDMENRTSLYLEEENPRAMRDYLRPILNRNDEQLIIVNSKGEPWKVIETFETLLQLMES
jgi:hypothetical protein